MFDFLRRLIGRTSRFDFVPKTYTEKDETSGKMFRDMQRYCPSCGIRPPVWMEGPHGGINVNVYCGACGEGYNIAAMVEFAQKIGKDERYILPQYKDGTHEA